MTTQMQPLFFGPIVNYLREKFPQFVGEMFEAYFYAFLLVLMCAIYSICMHSFLLTQFHAGMKMRIAMCSMIYRKSLRLSKTAFGETTAGQIVNLLSNDVGRLDLAIANLHYIWVGPLETIAVTYLMYREVSLASRLNCTCLTRRILSH